MFDKILIANRGEIACRIARSARRLGIRTVAVYSEADARTRHVALADEAYFLGPAPARESYLKGERLIEIARKSGAQAIHPGYGFLSENADFAQACLDAGIAFIGPPPGVLRAMGSKSGAKAIMAAALVPVIPGYQGSDQSLERLQQEADHLGYPLLVKATLGGGGKGMRIVRAAGELKEAVASAKREAASSFGADEVLLERYLDRPRHVEVQVFADVYGNVIHLFERDCSLQRRYQKVMEEAPAPGLAEESRSRLARAAVAAAQAVGYVGAGTVEFLVDQEGGFYFLEMNTRLQVEHPVTERVTGLDLVEWQFRIAAGCALPLRQEALEIHGHALEARLYAEDPARGFLPSGGRITYLRLPGEGPHVRVDSGVQEGDEVGVHYDPLIAKLIVWDTDRDAALKRLRFALGECEIAGVVTNLAFLASVAAHPDFARGGIDTGFVERHAAELLPESGPTPHRVLAIAATSELLRLEREAHARAGRSSDRYSPWHRCDGWRLNADGGLSFLFLEGERQAQVIVRRSAGCVVLGLPTGIMAVQGELGEGGEILLELDGERIRARVVREGGKLLVFAGGLCHRLTLKDPLSLAEERESAAGGLTAPVPGTVVEVLIKPGDRVEKGAPLVVLEAMKMEHTLTAPAAGTVKAVRVGKGERVTEGDELVELESDDP